MTLADTYIRGGNRALDFSLGVKSEDVLNSGTSTEKFENPAQAMMKASKSLLTSGVNPDTGLVDYLSCRKGDAYAWFRRISRELSECDPDDIGHGPVRLAFWISLYNALIFDAVVRFGIKGSIMSRPGIFRQAAYNVGGMRFSADEIEHGILRRNRHHPILRVRPFTASDPRLSTRVDHLDPRIHFSLVCGARSCPSITFYDPEHLDRQLDQAAAAFINGDGIFYTAATNTIQLSKILQWYQSDFGGLPSILGLVQHHVSDQEIRKVLEGGDFRVRYMRYDWTVNTSNELL